MEVIEVGPPGPMRCRAAWPGPTPIYPSRAGSPLRCGLSKCRNVGLAGANAHGLVDVEHKYLPVPDLPSLRGRSDGLDGVVDQLARHRYLDLDLRQEGHCVFGPPIELAMAPLAPISLDLGHCHSRDADRIESIADVLELKRLDDGNDDLHRRTQSLTASPPRTGYSITASAPARHVETQAFAVLMLMIPST